MARTKKTHVVEILETLRKDNPEPTTELVYSTPLELLVAVSLSAQTTDKAVNKATPGLFARCKKPQDFIELGVEGVVSFIKTIGLHNQKAKNIVRACELMIERHNGNVPREAKDLEALPGVGRKTASVVRNVLYGDATIPVDTHIFRVSHRLGLAKGKTPSKVQDELEALVPDDLKKIAHHLFILHGRYVCTARKPKCESCLVGQWCPSQKELQTNGR